MAPATGAPMVILTVLLLACAGAGGFAFFGVTVVRRLFRRNLVAGHNDTCAAIFQTGGTLYAVFLAFLVVAVWQSHDAAHANVAEEASLFGEGTLRLANHLFATAGLRLEYARLVDHALDQVDVGSEPHRHVAAVLPSLGMLWKAADDVSVYARY